jgi:hypothetical protein
MDQREAAEVNSKYPKNSELNGIRSYNLNNSVGIVYDHENKSKRCSPVTVITSDL